MGIVIPVYNCEKFVEEAVMSVSNQPCKDLIIVVVDDGSTDSSYRLCECIAQKDTRIKVIHQDNAGVSAARNRGIQYCIDVKTEYIAFLDADDVWIKNVYTEELKEKISDESIDVVSFGWIKASENLKRGKQYANPEEIIFNSDKVFNSICWRGVCTYFYRKDIICDNSISFPEGKAFSEDMVFMIMYMAYVYKAYRCSAYLFAYRSNFNSALHRYKNIAERILKHDLLSWKYGIEYAEKKCKENPYTYFFIVGKCEAMMASCEMIWIDENCKVGKSVKVIEDERLQNTELLYIENKIESIYMDDLLKRKRHEWDKNKSEYRLKMWIGGITEKIIHVITDLLIFRRIAYVFRYPKIELDKQNTERIE